MNILLTFREVTMFHIVTRKIVVKLYYTTIILLKNIDYFIV